MSDPELLELLDFYIDLTEKQSEAILDLSRLAKKQATELAHLRNMEMAEKTEAEILMEQKVLNDMQKEP